MTAAAETSPEGAERLARRVGMTGLIVTETSFFATAIVVYLYYVGRSLTGPQPAEVLEMPWVNTACLLSSSITIVYAMRCLRRGDVGSFNVLVALTVLLGTAFLVGTGLEWKGLIEQHGLTITTNLFGTTFYSLVGFHAFHVTLGLTLLTVVFGLGLSGRVTPQTVEPVEMLSWYWHFVDVVWIAVFTVVYVVGR